MPEKIFAAGFEPQGWKRINKYFNLRRIESIKVVLEDEYMEMLMGSQFGRIMQMGHHTFSVSFVHYLLSRQLVTNMKYELW